MGMFDGRDLYVILIEDDNSMTITRKRRIVQGSNLVDHLCFLVNSEYNGYDMEKFDAVLSYVPPNSFELQEEILCKSSEPYKNLLTFVLPFDSKITDEAGSIDLMLTFQEHNNGEHIRNITGATIDIISDVSHDEPAPGIGLDEVIKQIAKVNKQIKEINKTSDLIIDNKADNVSYDNLTGDLQLKANGHPIGDIVNIGFPSSGGNDILIVNITTPYYPYAYYTSSHNASEIKSHLNNGGFVVGRIDGTTDAILDKVGEDYVSFCCHFAGGGSSCVYTIYEDRVVFTDYKHTHDGDYVKTINGIAPDENGNLEITIPDSGGYATESWVQDNYQEKGNYLTEHQDISGKLDADRLPEAISTALAQAKESGVFDGPKGDDYVLTPADKEEIAEIV